MEETKFDYINVIPLVDIMLVLLTIVLTTSTLVATGTIPLELPQASKHQNNSNQLQIIEIDKNGAIFFSGKSVNLGSLKEKISDFNRTTPILIRADKELTLQVFIDVLDVIKQLKFSAVSIETDVH
jgi:biopolymer transport protein ExbD